jgi:hypothetical protein
MLSLKFFTSPEPKKKKQNLNWLKQNLHFKTLGEVIQAFKPSTGEAKAGESWVQGLPELQRAILSQKTKGGEGSSVAGTCLACTSPWIQNPPHHKTDYLIWKAKLDNFFSVWMIAICAP